MTPSQHPACLVTITDRYVRYIKHKYRQHVAQRSAIEQTLCAADENSEEVAISEHGRAAGFETKMEVR